MFFLYQFVHMQILSHYILKAHYILIIGLYFNILILDLINHHKHDQMCINVLNNYMDYRYTTINLPMLMSQDYNIRKVEFFSYLDVLELLK
jgi:hypothetical protein